MDIKKLYSPKYRRLQVDEISIRRVDEKDLQFLKRLFDIDDISQYYVITLEQRDDLRKFIEYTKTGGLFYIKENSRGESMGLFSCEFNMKSIEGDAYIGYAILPEYRRHGYTEKILRKFIQISTTCHINNIVLDINDSNDPSQRMAIKCGFKKTDREGIFIDERIKEASPSHLWNLNLNQK